MAEGGVGHGESTGDRDRVEGEGAGGTLTGLRFGCIAHDDDY